jgi:hypothetical protein
MATDNKPCMCSGCIQTRFTESIRTALLSTPERRQVVREVLKAALTLLDESTPCDCPTCAPERWEQYNGTWIKDGNICMDIQCKLNL